MVSLRKNLIFFIVITFFISQTALVFAQDVVIDDDQETTPIYELGGPIVFYIDDEVTLQVGDTTAKEQIILAEGYAPKNTLKISDINFEYHSEGDKTRTKLCVKPEEVLDYGKYYILTIKDNVLENQDGQFLPEFTIHFTTDANSRKQSGINVIEPNTFNLIDIYKGTAAFTIKGYNYSEDIQYITLNTISEEGTKSVQTTVYKEDMEFKSVTEINVKLINPQVIDTLLKAGGGEYSLELFFENRQQVSNDDVKLKILPRGRPKVLARDPLGGSIWANEKMLNPRTIDGVTRYFLRITFEDFDGSLYFDKDSGLYLLQTSTLFSEGQDEVSMMDREFINFIQNIEDRETRDSYISKYIFVKDRDKGQAHLYVPVKPLRSQTTYTVMVNVGIVGFDSINEGTVQNDAIHWDFTTTAVPVVGFTGIGSVTQYYDEDEPIVLSGDFFDERNVEVCFNDVEAYRVRTRTDEGETLLEVYLPRGRNRLTPGIYTILVRNDRDHEFEVFGAFSVVKEGSHVPNEEYKVKVKERVGEVRSNLTKSEDTLVLSRPYTDRRSVEVDLDELMGEEVLVRKIRFDGRRNDRISTLETLSKWADITLYDVGRTDYDRDEDPDIILGRVDPGIAQNLGQRLGRQQIKSEFIQVMGENVRFTSLRITMPFKESGGDNLKVLRYDNYMMDFVEEDFLVDKINKTLTIRSYSGGVFVVVEG